MTTPSWRKIDQVLVAEGEHASSVVPVWTGGNTQSSFADRHVGQAFGYLDSGAAVFATCPGIPQGHPILLPVYTGARNVVVRLRYAAANGAAAAGQPAVRARLIVETYPPGAWVNLTVTSSTTFADVECAIPLQRRRRRLSAQIQFESIRGPLQFSGSNLDVSAIYGDQRIAGNFGLSSGVQYKSIVFTSTEVGIEFSGAREEYLLGHTDTVPGPDEHIIWPALDGALRSADTIDGTGTSLYHIGKLTLYGWMVYVEGSDVDATELAGCPAIPSQCYTNRRMSASTFRAINAAARRTYSDRGRWWCSHPNPEYAGDYLGSHVDAADTVFGALCEVRSGSVGIVAGCLYLLHAAAAPTTIVWTVDFFDDANASIGTITHTSVWNPQTITPSIDGNTGSIVMANMYGRAPAWAQRDLIGAAEHVATGTSGALGRFDQPFAWPVGVAVGDLVIVRIKADVNVHALAACIAEDGI